MSFILIAIRSAMEDSCCIRPPEHYRPSVTLTRLPNLCWWWPTSPYSGRMALYITERPSQPYSLTAEIQHEGTALAMKAMPAYNLTEPGMQDLSPSFRTMAVCRLHLCRCSTKQGFPQGCLKDGRSLSTLWVNLPW